MRNSCIVIQRLTNNLPDKFNVIIPPQDITCYPGCIQRLAEGDREAYAWVYKNYCKKVYEYAMLITGNEATSEDVVQETFLKLWQHRKKLTEIENFNSYLFILYRNHIQDVLKRQQKEIVVRQEYTRNTSMHVITADQVFNYNETRRVIAKTVKQLPHQRQQVYTLGRECGWKREQIAKELQISPFTVRGHMQKALKYLKCTLQEIQEEN